MQTNRKILVCFTASFPYGLKETFFENELPFLAKQFEKILIIPVINYSTNSTTRALPSNVEFLSPTVSSSKIERIFKGLFNLSPLRLYINDFFRGKVYTSRKRMAQWFNSMLMFRTGYRRFTHLLKEGFFLPEETMLYSYWGEAPLYTTSLTKSMLKIVRMHRVDFYEEVNDNYLPLRKKIYNSADILLPISEDIFSRLITDYGVKEDKITISRLGVDNKYNSNILTKKNMNVIRIVSCSRVDPVKRIDLIWKILLNHLGDEQIEWHHFGDGTEYDNLKKIINEQSIQVPTVKVVFHGWTKQEDLFQFYQTHYVDWFLNVSESEGIPVSIMEAMSFSIPVIATDVGATSEIVNNNNGYLINVSFNNIDVLSNILSVAEKDNILMRENAYVTWRDKYQATANYNELNNLLSKYI